MATSNNEIEERLAYLDSILASGTDEEVGELRHQLLGSPPPLPITIVRAVGMRQMFISTSGEARLVTTPQYDTVARPASPILRALLTEEEAATTESEEEEDISPSSKLKTK